MPPDLFSFKRVMEVESGYFLWRSLRSLSWPMTRMMLTLLGLESTFEVCDCFCHHIEPSLVHELGWRIYNDPSGFDYY